MFYLSTSLFYACFRTSLPKHKDLLININTLKGDGVYHIPEKQIILKVKVTNKTKKHFVFKRSDLTSISLKKGKRYTFWQTDLINTGNSSGIKVESGKSIIFDVDIKLFVDKFIAKSKGNITPGPYITSLTYETPMGNRSSNELSFELRK